MKVSPRSSFPMCVAPPHWAYAFGGVVDNEEEDEEDLDSTFFNDLYCLSLDTVTWRTGELDYKIKIICWRILDTSQRMHQSSVRSKTLK